VLERTARFVRTLPQVVQRFNAPLEYADLRHPGGYAVRLRGVGTSTAAAGPAAKKN
jgi:cell division protein FtsQ